jgi:hypothetical protein
MPISSSFNRASVTPMHCMRHVVSTSPLPSPVMMAVFHHGVLSSPAAGRLDGEKCPRKLVARSFPKDACTFFRLIVGFVLGAEGLGVVGDYVCFLYFLWGCLGLFYFMFSNSALCFLANGFSSTYSAREKKVKL